LTLFVVLSSRYLERPSSAFPVGEEIVVTEGAPQSDITDMLAARHIVRSSLYLYLYLRQHYPDEFIKAGTYRFEDPLRTSEVAEALISGKDSTPLLKVTFPEGFRADRLLSYLPESLRASTTVNLAQFEGYLFPDTYFITAGTSVNDIITLLTDTFRQKVSPLAGDIAKSGYTEREVVTLASIVEREAKDARSKRIVAGILENRLAEGMPLQVDAAFDYLLGKESSELTDEDLTLDSPYNTYKYAGLPPTPISNPGLDAIEAVLQPERTDYLYYLTDADGNFHYAKTFEEHKANKQRYLK
ncbi:MAG TPA: endolytic transglycosylase MltG, partial [Candidatus Paceibacterota bacterium]|nr:endolytic transglycosylase MltG [Candidatus Paceibacterota bacterium]